MSRAKLPDPPPGSELSDLRRELAKYHGSISRWCDLTGNAQPGTGDKTAAELAAFETYLGGMAHARRFQF